MILAEDAPIPDAARDADVVVVGAGAVGIPLAVVLARRGLRVTLLEAGPTAPPVDYVRANASRSTGRPHIGLETGRMKALGGTTRLWGGQLVPFTRSDIEDQAFPGQPHWPFDHATYLRHVGQVLDLLGIPQGARDPRAVWSRMTGESPQFGPSLEVGMNLWLPQPDFAKLFATDLAAPGLLTVITRAPVERLEFSAPGQVSTVHTPRGPFRAPRVVLACGTIEIARLLLHTAATEPACGFAANRHLGKWFMDHLHGVIGTVSGARPAALGTLFDYVHHQGLRYGVKLRLTDDARRLQCLCNGVATINPAMGLRQGLAELITLFRRLFSGNGGLGPALRHTLAMARITLPLAWRYLVRRRSSLGFAAGVSVGVEFEQIPNENSYIFLDQETGRAGINWQVGAHEMATVRAIALALRQEFADRSLGTLHLNPQALEGSAEFLDSCHDAYHQMGGARLAAGPDQGVVDHDLKLFGTNNIFIAGAAVFPSGSFANPTLTALALTLRLADHLTEANR